MRASAVIKNAIAAKCRACGLNVGWVELWASLGLGAFKLFIGLKCNSHALIAAAFYSVQDLISAGAIISSIRYANKDEDEQHPYGTGKIEYIASVIVSLAVIIGAAILLVSAGKSIWLGPKNAPHWIAFWAAVVAVLCNYFLYRYSMCAGKTLSSPAIISNAEHTRGDAISSTCVAVGVLLSKMGLRHMDPLIAIVEVGHVIHMSSGILIRGIKGLMDSSLSEGDVKKIRDVAGKTRGVRSVASIKTRELGQSNEICVEILVDPAMSVAQGTHIAAAVKANLTRRIPKSRYIQVFVSPLTPDLAQKKAVTTAVRTVLEKYYRQNIRRHELNIHNGAVELSVTFFPKVPGPMRAEVCTAMRREIQEMTPGKTVLVGISEEKK